MDSFCQRLKERRKNLGLTQAELAAMLEVSSQVISNWERGYTQPNLSELFIIAQTLGISSDELLGLNTIGYPTYDLQVILDSNKPLILGQHELRKQDRMLISQILFPIFERIKYPDDY